MKIDLNEALEKRYFTETKESNIKFLYHRSLSKINNFNAELSKEIGLHCGTKQQANNKPGMFLYRIELLGDNFLSLPYDITSTYSSMEFLNILKQIGTISNNEYLGIVNELRAIMQDSNKQYKYSEIFRQILINKGYIGFSYPNKIESEGLSYCIIDPKCINKFELAADIIINACKAETGVDYEIVDYNYNSVIVKPKQYNGRRFFHNPVLMLDDYNAKTDSYTFSYDAI